MVRSKPIFSSSSLLCVANENNRNYSKSEVVLINCKRRPWFHYGNVSVKNIVFVETNYGIIRVTFGR